MSPKKRKYKFETKFVHGLNINFYFDKRLFVVSTCYIQINLHAIESYQRKQFFTAFFCVRFLTYAESLNNISYNFKTVKYDVEVSLKA